MVREKEIGELIFILMLVVSLVLAPIVSAVTTPIEFRGYPNHNLSAYVINSNDGSEITSLNQDIDSSGITTINLDSGTVKFYVVATIKKEGKIIKKAATYGNYTAGNSVYINLNEEIPATPVVAVAEPAENTTEENEIETNTTEGIVEETATIEPNSEAKITGKSIFSGENILAKKWYIIIVASVLFASVIVFFVIKKVKSPAAPENIKIRKYSEMKEELEARKEDESSVSYHESSELLEAEKKIKEAQEDIERIKNKGSRLREAERKFEEAKNELEKLKAEE